MTIDSDDSAPLAAAERQVGDAAIIAVGNPAKYPTAPAGEKWAIGGYARIIRLGAGLRGLSIGKSDTSRNTIAGFAFPATQVAPHSGEPAGLTIVSNSDGSNGWIGTAGGKIVLRVPEGGATVVVTTYGVADEAAMPSLTILDLDRATGADAPASPLLASEITRQSGRDIAGELILHIERQGDRRFPAGEWAGNLNGERLRIEGFAIRPLQAVAPGQIEYMAFGPGGRQTPWVTDVKLCGTRGRGFPLTGFAIRVVPALRDRFDVIYDGHFFNSGIVGPIRDGEPCLPATADDPLGAIRVRIIERLGS
jgi:hypothetical protein